MAERTQTLDPYAHWNPNVSVNHAYSNILRDSVRNFSETPSNYLQALVEQRIAEILDNNRPITTRLADIGPNPITHNTISNASNNATPDPTQDRPPVTNAIHNTNDNHNMWEELTNQQRVVTINPDGDTVRLRPMHSYNSDMMRHMHSYTSDMQATTNAYTNSDSTDASTRWCEETRDKYHKELLNEFREAMPQYDQTPQTLQVFKEYIATKGLADITDSENQLIIELANIALLHVLKRNNSLTKEVKEYKTRTQRYLESLEVLRKEKDDMRIAYERAQIDLTRTMMGHERELKKKDDEIKRLRQTHTNRTTQTSPNGPNRVSDSETINPTVGPGDYLEYLGQGLMWEPTHLRVNHGNTGTNSTNTLQWNTRPRWD